MSLPIVILLFLIGLVLIVKGGDVFVDAASNIAKASGIPSFIIGATIVSVATTLPEIIVSITAAIQGKTEMAIGNAVGSVTANTGMILALGIVFIPVAMRRKNFAFKGVLLIVSILSLMILSRNNLAWYEGLFLFALFIVFIIENIKEAKSGASKEERHEMTKKEFWRNILMFAIGAAAIVGGSQLLVNNGTTLATRLGIPENIISLTAIAIGTSLPELVTAITSIVKKQTSLSVGNVLGANIIDMALILPICSFISGGILPVESQTMSLDLPVCLLVAIIIVVPALIKEKFYRWQGFLAMAVYAAYLIVICK